MALTNWNLLEQVDGEKLELFVATCLRLRHKDALQNQPSQGDAGIDVYRETPDGLIVWQVKRFSSPITSSQKTQIKHSWRTFCEEHVAPGTPISQYFLVTPWTPTKEARTWFSDEVVGEAEFAYQWDGASFLEGLATEFPAVYGRAFKGEGYFEEFTAAKALLAQSPVESADSMTMLKAVRKRQAALQEIADGTSDHYNIDLATVTSTDGSLPLPSSSSAAIAHQYTFLGNNRYQVESLVPQHAQAQEVDPISLDIVFEVEPGSEQERELNEWKHWGRPFDKLPGRSRTVGGPWHEEEPGSSLISLERHPQLVEHPPLRLEILDEAESSRGKLILSLDEVTHGVVGEGVRTVASSPSGVIRFEMRMGSSTAPEEHQIQIKVHPGSDPQLVLDDIDALNTLRAGDSLKLARTGDGASLTFLIEEEAPAVGKLIAQVAGDLRYLQQHTTSTLLMPDMDKVSEFQTQELHALANIYRGESVTRTWTGFFINIEREEQISLIGQLSEAHTAIFIEHPEFELGDKRYVITQRMARQFKSLKLAEENLSNMWQVGDSPYLIPETDNTVELVAIQTDNIEGTAGAGQ